LARIKVDEDLPGEIATLLRAGGHDALSVFEQHLTGTTDDKLWPLIQAESRILFTADKGFGDVRAHPPATHAGVVLFRLPRESRAAYIRLVEGFMK
jgi:predicted nuclease of predicted toxin-antitoxin system